MRRNGPELLPALKALELVWALELVQRSCKAAAGGACALPSQPSQHYTALQYPFWMQSPPPRTRFVNGRAPHASTRPQHGCRSLLHLCVEPHLMY